MLPPDVLSRGAVRLAAALLCGVLPFAAADTAATADESALFPTRVELSLPDYLQRVLEHNEAVQARLFSYHAARAQRLAEAGVFEPALVASGEYVDRQRPNTIEVERSLRSGGFFVERNQNYSTALEFRTPLGTRVRLGGGARRLVNNVQRTVLVDLEAEYEASVGLSFEQPLLKGGGFAATLAGIRLAARTSDVAFQEYRRQLMLVVAEAELAYWQLHFAQEEFRLARESLAVAQSLVADNRTRFDAGRGSRLDVLEAEAGAALRQSRLAEARQKLVEAVNRLAAFFAASPQDQRTQFVATEAPRSQPLHYSFETGVQTALTMSPDLLRARGQVEQEKVRVSFARNQRLPQLDLKASFGSSGLGFDYTTAWKDVQDAEFPAWTVALEMRVPLFGGVREANELRVARHRLRQAELTASDAETQVRSGLDTALHRVASAYETARNYSAVVEFRSGLLDTQMQAAEVGRANARAVLEAEQELFAARLEQLRSENDYQRALLELQILTGNLLHLRGIELEREELERKTLAWLKQGGEKLELLDYRAPDLEAMPALAPLPYTPAPDPAPAEHVKPRWRRTKR